MNKYTVSRTVSGAILEQETKFTEKDIFNSVNRQLSNYFQDTVTMKKYIHDKLNSMVELGLVGRTSCYYFPV